MSGAEPSRDAERTLIEVLSLREESPEEILLLVYQELRQMARAYMRRERAGHTLQATALVNQVYLRLLTVICSIGKTVGACSALSPGPCGAFGSIMREVAARSGPAHIGRLRLMIKVQ